MRTFAVAIVVAACVGAAFAQDAPTDGRFMPSWDRMPNAYDFAGNYPRAAMEDGISGVAVLCCTPRPDRTLDCRVGYEWPENRRFGQASLRVARRFRMSEISYAEFQSDPSNWLQVPVRWQTGRSLGFQRELDRINHETQALCRPSTPENQSGGGG